MLCSGLVCSTCTFGVDSQCICECQLQLSLSGLLVCTSYYHMLRKFLNNYVVALPPCQKVHICVPLAEVMAMRILKICPQRGNDFREREHNWITVTRICSVIV